MLKILHKIISFQREIIKFSIFVIIIYINFLSCSNPVSHLQTPPSESQAVSIKQLYISCTEAFIKVSAADSVLPVTIKLNRNDSTFTNFILSTRDTIITDSALISGRNYSYQTIAVFKGREQAGEKLEVKTLNITSNNITWQKYEFGEVASSVIRDVAIVDDNNIYAVGEIYMKDSLGQPDPIPYNLAKWDGKKWELLRIKFYTICGQTEKVPYPASSIFAFSPTDIWVGDLGDQISHYDGNIQNSILCLPFSFAIKKLWIKSSEEIYIVGNSGYMVFYNGKTWMKIESGTTLDFVDIWGDTNPFTEETEILCGAVHGIDNPGYDEIISIKNDLSTEKLDVTGLGRSFASPWFKAGIKYYLAGGGLYEKTFKDTTRWVNLNNGLTDNFMDCIRGTDLNNIFVAGAFGEILHFNGLSWISLKNGITSLEDGSYYSLAVKSNIVVAGGFDQGKAVILIGKN